MRKLLQRRKEAYQRSFQKHGTVARALKWQTQKAANIRYQNLTAEIDFNGKSVIDLGCGFGDAIPFIEKKSKNFTYLGVDLVPEFIQEARRRYPKHSFLVGPWQELIRKSDIILLSGALNSKVGKGEYSYRRKAISLMYQHANEALAFNMAGGFPQPKNKSKNKVYYVDSLKILKFCYSLTGKVILRHHYRKKDFTIVVFRS